MTAKNRDGDVLILRASPRNGHGADIADRLGSHVARVRQLMGEELTGGVLVEALSSYTVGACLGCGYCATNPGFCRYDADLRDNGRELLSLITGSAGVILVAPIWFYGIPAQAKALIDRSQTLWELKQNDHRPFPCKGQPFACVFTAARKNGERLFEAASLVTRCFAENLGFTWREPLCLRDIDNTAIPDTELGPWVKRVLE